MPKPLTPHARIRQAAKRKSGNRRPMAGGA